MALLPLLTSRFCLSTPSTLTRLDDSKYTLFERPFACYFSYTNSQLLPPVAIQSLAHVPC